MIPGDRVLFRELPATVVELGEASRPGGARVKIARIDSPRYGKRVVFAHELQPAAPARPSR